MDNTVKIGLFSLLLFNILIVSNFRTALFDCFKRNGYKKTYRQIHKKQTVLNRITLGYILLFIKKQNRAFVIVRRYYVIYLIISGALFIFIVALYYIFGKTICISAIIVDCIINSVVAFLIRIRLFPHGDVAANSIFVKRKR